jgi:hypothetical protein
LPREAHKGKPQKARRFKKLNALTGRKSSQPQQPRSSNIPHINAPPRRFEDLGKKLEEEKRGAVKSLAFFLSTPLQATLF